MKENLIVTVLFLCLALIVIFSFAPVGHILGQWNDWWDGNHTVSMTSSAVQAENTALWERYSNAMKDCEAHGGAFFGTTKTVIVASSTSDDTNYGAYRTYDCWGLKLIKI